MMVATTLQRCVPFVSGMSTSATYDAKAHICEKRSGDVTVAYRGAIGVPSGSGSDTPTWLVGAGRVSSGPLGLQPIASYFLTCHSLESRGT